MAKAKKEADEGDVVEDVNIKQDTYEVAVLSAIRERAGFSYGQFDHVDVKYLWADNYRINCHKSHRIAESYFVSYSKHEGIYRCIPEV